MINVDDGALMMMMRRTLGQDGVRAVNSGMLFCVVSSFSGVGFLIIKSLCLFNMVLFAI